MRPGQSLADLSNRLLASLHDALRSERPISCSPKGTRRPSWLRPWRATCWALRSATSRRASGPIGWTRRSPKRPTGWPSAICRPSTSPPRRGLREPAARRDRPLDDPPDRQHRHRRFRIRRAPRHASDRRTRPHKRLVLVTVHRRENQGEPLRRICRSVREIHDRFEDVEILWPVHPNPAVGPIVAEMVGGLPRARLVEPLSYGRIRDRDATGRPDPQRQRRHPGGGRHAGKPVLVLRQVSERDEAVQCGAARLVGCDPEVIASASARGCSATRPTPTVRSGRIAVRRRPVGLADRLDRQETPHPSTIKAVRA